MILKKLFDSYLDIKKYCFFVKKNFKIKGPSGPCGPIKIKAL